MKIERIVLTDHRHADGQDVKALALTTEHHRPLRVEFGRVVTHDAQTVGVLYVRGYNPITGSPSCSVIHLDDDECLALAKILLPHDTDDDEEIVSTNNSDA